MSPPAATDRQARQPAHSWFCAVVAVCCPMGALIVTRFSEQLWEEIGPVWTAIRGHPFLMELQAGTLPLETFRYYVIQDFHYLAGFGRAVATALGKAADGGLARQLLPRIATPIERPLHRRLFDLLDIDDSEAAATEVSPTNKAYTDHLEVTAASGGVGPAAAALLPCPWTYHQLGSVLRRPKHPIYHAWFEGYASGLLAESTAAWRELVDEFGGLDGPVGRDAMRRAFTVSARYEYMFWTMAYTMERWPVSIDAPVVTGPGPASEDVG